MKQYLNISNWNRKEHYEYFCSFDDPYLAFTARIDCTKTYLQAKADNTSFFIYSLHQILLTVNEIECFRYRIENEKVVCYDVINISSVIGRNDETYAFVFFDYNNQFTDFKNDANKKIEQAKQTTGLHLSADSHRQDTVYLQVIPWINFSQLKHPNNLKTCNSVPRITTGKLHFEDGRVYLSVDVCVHHGLIDALQIYQFMNGLEQRMK